MLLPPYIMYIIYSIYGVYKLNILLLVTNTLDNISKVPSTYILGKVFILHKLLICCIWGKYDLMYIITLFSFKRCRKKKYINWVGNEFSDPWNR